MTLYAVPCGRCAEYIPTRSPKPVLKPICDLHLGGPAPATQACTEGCGRPAPAGLRRCETCFREWRDIQRALDTWPATRRAGTN